MCLGQGDQLPELDDEEAQDADDLSADSGTDEEVEEELPIEVDPVIEHVARAAAELVASPVTKDAGSPLKPKTLFHHDEEGELKDEPSIAVNAAKDGYYTCQKCTLDHLQIV